MTFDEAAQRFRMLEQQLASGQINMDQYRSGLNDCRVVDASGRTWMPQERTGEWYVYINGQWVQGTALQPPKANAGFQAPAQFAAAMAQQPQYTSMKRPSDDAPSKGGTSLAVSLVFWFIIMVAIGVILYLVSKEPKVLLGVGAAAVISLIIVLANAASAWEGRIVDIHTSIEHHYDSDGDRQTRRVTYAYVDTPDGKTKKLNRGVNWQVGDYLIKRKGETSPRLYKQGTF